MLNLGRVVFIAVFLSFGVVYAASVKAMVDTVEVMKGNSVTLRIKTTGSNAVFPNIPQINGVPVQSLGTSRQSNMHITSSGIKNETSTVKKYSFVPEQNMTIPSYTVNIDGQDYQTQAIDIKVVKSNNGTLQGDEIFHLNMQANKTKVMLGEPFIVTVYFYLKEGVRLSQDVQYSPPLFSDFVAINIPEQTTYTKGNYQVQEIRYIVTPQKEGNFSISPAQAKVGVADISRRDIFGLNHATKWTQIRSNSLNIKVLPLKVEADLIGDFNIDTSVDKKLIKANKPVNLTLRIEGEGSLEGFEFLEYEIDDVTVYSDEAKIETKIVDGEIFSTYTKSFAFISDKDFTIPSREISVYNPQTKEKKSLEFKGFEIEVEGSNQAIVARQASSQNIENLKNTDEAEVITKEVDMKQFSWWMLALTFVLGMLFMYGVQFLAKWLKSKEKKHKDYDALQILYGHIGESKEVEDMVRKLYAKKNGDKAIKIDKKELNSMLERFR